MQTVRHFIIGLLALQAVLGGSLCRMWCCGAESARAVKPATAATAPQPAGERSHCHAPEAAMKRPRAEHATRPLAPQHHADQPPPKRIQGQTVYAEPSSTALVCPCAYPPVERLLMARARTSSESFNTDESFAGAAIHLTTAHESRGVAIPRFQSHSPPRTHFQLNLRI